mmetsp:Transcript_27992/g.58107  ORF Transcript_27992/g.58107 Transcript_27992/m.58107 type:complete len:403 (+) Transcript_27992:1198-2406(+)
MKNLPPLFVNLPVQRPRHREEHHAHDEGDQLPARPEDGREEGQEPGSAEDVSVDLLPARVFDARHAVRGGAGAVVQQGFAVFVHVVFRVVVVVRSARGHLDVPPSVGEGVARVIFPQRSEQDERHEPHEEEHHHEGVENAEPMYLVFEEGVVQVAVEARVELLRGLGPLDVQFEFENRPRLDLGQRGRVRREIHLDDPLFVVAYLQSPLGVDVGLERPAHGLVPGHRLLEVREVRAEVLRLGRVQVRQHLAHHAPHGEVVDVHLVEPLVVGRGGEELGLGVVEGLGGASLQDARFADGGVGGVDEVVARVAEGVAAEALADGVRFQFVELAAAFCVGVVDGVGGAVREDVVFVGFLRVGVGAHLIDPKIHLITGFVSMCVFIGGDIPYGGRADEGGGGHREE